MPCRGSRQSTADANALTTRWHRNETCEWELRYRYAHTEWRQGCRVPGNAMTHAPNVSLVDRLNSVRYIAAWGFESRTTDLRIASKKPATLLRGQTRAGRTVHRSPHSCTDADRLVLSPSLGHWIKVSRALKMQRGLCDAARSWTAPTLVARASSMDYATRVTDLRIDSKTGSLRVVKTRRDARSAWRHYPHDRPLTGILVAHVWAQIRVSRKWYSLLLVDALLRGSKTVIQSEVITMPP